MEVCKARYVSYLFGSLRNCRNLGSVFLCRRSFICGQMLWSLAAAISRAAKACFHEFFAMQAARGRG
jgi:hypothetical protein